jgi:sugar phosphate permease
MNTAEIVLGLGAVAVIAAIISWAHGRSRPADLGSVSHQWIAEQRLSQTQDSQR